MRYENKDGYLTIKVTKIDKGTLKNGKTTYTVRGDGSRRHTGTKIDQAMKSMYMTFKADTKVNVI